jgi:hypothetical protein
MFALAVALAAPSGAGAATTIRESVLGSPATSPTGAM